MSCSDPVFPFGRPARALPPIAIAASTVILGAYPSALHIRWVPPAPWKPVRALAVDLEPHAFWNGADEADRVENWRRAVGWQSEWGTAEPAGHLNGSSGVWVDEMVLAPLSVPRDRVWITDSLHWYCASKRGARRVADTYAHFAISRGLPEASLPGHPSEGEIVRQAGAEWNRLRAELRAAAPYRVVTLGNAALRVLAELVEGDVPQKLSPGDGYAQPAKILLEGRPLELLPLCHPAAPLAYQEAQAAWVRGRGAQRP